MHNCQGLRTFFANGWFDLVTQTSLIWHTCSHAHLPKERTFFKGYFACHMPYLGEENAHELSNDIHSFLMGKNPTL